MLGFGFFIAFILWVLAFLVLVGRRKAGPYVLSGLAGAYLLNLALPHFISAVVQLLPWNVYGNQAVTVDGFVITGYAIFGLLAGVLVIAPLVARVVLRRIPSGGGLATFSRVPTYCLIGGLLAYFVILGAAGRLPGITAVFSGGMHLGVTGYCLLWWRFWNTGRYTLCWFVIFSSILIPMLTVTIQGFLGFGVTPILMIGSFVAVHYRPRWVIAALGVSAVFLGLSVYPVYMEVRETIRRAVWGGQDMIERMNTIYTAFSSGWRWFDPEDVNTLYAIEGRLNQNILIGHAHGRLSEGLVEFANGETFLDAGLALIPRFIWPDKPERAGSRGLVSRFTGLEFAEGTSVGIGHIMEFYVNFGTVGVLIGYLLFGAVIGAIDIVSGDALQRGNWPMFVYFYVVGAATTNVGGNFAEMTASAAGCFVLTFAIMRFAVPANISSAYSKPMSRMLPGMRPIYRPIANKPPMLSRNGNDMVPQLPAPVDDDRPASLGGERTLPVER